MGNTERRPIDRLRDSAKSGHGTCQSPSSPLAWCHSFCISSSAGRVSAGCLVAGAACFGVAYWLAGRMTFEDP